MNIITFTGLSASGKSAIGEGVATNLNLPFVSYGKIADKLAIEKGFSGIKAWIKNEGIKKVSNESRPRLLAVAGSLKNESGIIIDGIADPKTFDLLREQHPNARFLTIYIKTNRHARRHWLLKRLEAAEPGAAIREMRQIDYLKEQIGIREIIKGAQIRVENVGNIKSLISELSERLRREILEKPSVAKEKEL